MIGTLLEPAHFYFAPYREIFENVVERYYADDTIDALLVAESVQKRCATLWRIEEREAVDKVVALKGVTADAPPLDLAALIKRHADYRELLKLSDRLRASVQEEQDDPEALAGQLSSAAMKIATDAVVRHEVYSYGEDGREWTQRTRSQIAAVEAGVEVGARFGIRAIDDFTKGLQPGNLLVCGAEPGMGKSALWQVAATNHARAQVTKDPQRRIGTLYFSLEMSREETGDRYAQRIGGVDGDKLRMSTLSRDELFHTAQAWALEKELPLYTNYSGYLRISQVRAILSEEMRKGRNVGVAIIDHFRFLRPDDKTLKGNEADDEVVIGLKEMAKDLNVAIVCIAHTVKMIERADKRPRMSDLRGSGMISAFADFVAFVYRPFEHATQKQKDSGLVDEKDAELIWEKSRHSGKGSAEFMMNLAKMQIL